MSQSGCEKYLSQLQLVIPLETQSQTRYFRSLAEVTTGVPSPARARLSEFMRPF
ncbi:hypothetical protein [Sedimentibacter sp. MB31-C6]|uniref:hypothetical protein n=1 Tax=Sedimentibacter sp. MB31-C6 TaxID=3109366 RepID=UPI002DDD0EE9|nr:hypothetical protein [Sedimentibacter sp. MB36-C1]WSI04594.1 hypothetical protein U8307_02070 [Sedimentibacter sp. MB36-C1]